MNRPHSLWTAALGKGRTAPPFLPAVSGPTRPTTWRVAGLLWGSDDGEEISATVSQNAGWQKSAWHSPTTFAAAKWDHHYWFKWTITAEVYSVGGFSGFWRVVVLEFPIITARLFNVKSVYMQVEYSAECRSNWEKAKSSCRLTIKIGKHPMLLLDTEKKELAKQELVNQS